MSKPRKSVNQAPAGAPKAEAADKKPVFHQKYVPLYKRLTDVVISGVYAAYTASAVVDAVSWCHAGAALPMGSVGAEAVKQVCLRAKQVDLGLVSKVHKAWDEEIFPKDDNLLRLLFILVNVLALPLAFVMLFGAKENSWQKFALLHASIMLTIGIHTVASNCPGANATLVYQCAAALTIGAPLALLHRWWKDNSFETSSMCKGICRVTSFFGHVFALIALVYAVIIIGEWSAAKTGQEIQLVSPIIHQYTDEAFLQAKTHLGGVADQVAQKIQEMTKQ